MSRTTILGLSDHGIVLCGSTLQKVKPVPRTVHVCAKADIPKMKDIDDFTAEVALTDSKRSVGVTWTRIQDTLLSTHENKAMSSASPRRKKQIQRGYTLHIKVLGKVTEAEYLRVEIKELNIGSTYLSSRCES